MAKNTISTLVFKRDRLIAKLDLSKELRQGKTVAYGQLAADVSNDTTLDVTKQSLGSVIPQNNWSMTTNQGTGTITNVEELGAVFRITYDGVGATQDAGSFVIIISTADATAASFRTRNKYDIGLLPTVPGIGSNDPADIVNNPNIGGLQPGRPWISATLIMALDASGYSGTGDWLDSTDNGNNGVANGSPSYTAGEGSFFSFSGGASTGPGTNDSFSVADSATLDSMTDISFEMWIRIDTVQGTSLANLLFDKRSAATNGYVGFFTNTGYTFRVGTSSSSQFTYSSAPTTGSWQHIVVTTGSSGSNLYINNSEVASSAYTGNFANINTANSLLIGDISIAAMGVNSFKGDMGLFRIYDGVLSSSEITSLWNTTKNRFGF